MELFKKRGTSLTKGRYDRLEAVENEIKAFSLNNIDEIKRPVSFFVTFTTQEARERCIKYFGSSENIWHQTVYPVSSLKILDHDLPTIEANEPTNIIWENLAISE